MVRKTPDQDLGVDELSLEPTTMPPPPLSSARSLSPSTNGNYNNNSKSRTASLSPTYQPNTPKKRSAPTSTTKGPTGKRAKPAPKAKLKLNPPKRVREDVYNEPERLLGPKRSLLYTNLSLFPAILMDQETHQILASTSLGFRFNNFSYGELARASSAFQNDGSEGRHDEEWLAAAWVAHGERAAGRFEEMEEAKFREQWGGDLSGEEYSDSEDEGKGEVKESVESLEKAEEAKEAVAQGVVAKEVITEEVVANGKTEEIEEALVPEAFVEKIESFEGIAEAKEVEKPEDAKTEEAANPEEVSEVAEQVPVEEACEIIESLE